MPGGGLDQGEGLVESAQRETREETGFEVEIKSLVGIYQGSKGEKTWQYVVFGAEVIDLETQGKVDESVKEGKWFDRAYFLLMDDALLVHPAMKLVYRKAIEGKGLGLDSVSFAKY